MRFTALRNGVRSPIDITLNLPGMHNVLNALAAIAVAWELQVPDAAVRTALANFSGVGRRFQRYGDITLEDGRGFTLIDDYGHHPVEMRATLAAARGAFPGRRLVLAFQPHRYTRTRDLFEDFVQVSVPGGRGAAHRGLCRQRTAHRRRRRTQPGPGRACGRQGGTGVRRRRERPARQPGGFHPGRRRGADHGRRLHRPGARQVGGPGN
jgi:hypothetical protein